MNNNILNNILNKISKSLNIANNVIPIYKDTYPLINKAKNYLNKNQIKKTNNNIIKQKNTPNTNITNQKKNSSNSPKFFI